MKKLLLLLTLSAGIGPAFGSGCTPDTAGFPGGAFANPASLACIQQTAAYSATVTIRIPDSIDAHVFDTSVPAGRYYMYVDSLALDSVTGAPAGISTIAGPPSTVFLHPGDYGCVQIFGTTTASIGNYTLSLYGNGCAHGSISGIPLDSCYEGLLPSFFSYTLSVCAFVPICTPDSSAFTGGVVVYPSSLPCITPGSPYSGTVSIMVPDSVDASLLVTTLPSGLVYAHIDSIRIDSITGMPSGISAAYLPGSTVWLHGGQFSCALFSGTTNATPGNYPIGVYGRACGHGSYMGYNIDTCADKNLAAVFSFSLNVCNGPACTVDTSQFSGATYVYPPVLQCIVTGTAYSGQINIEVPDSLDLSDLITITGFTIPPGAGFAHIDSIDITTVTGYPAGINITTNPGLGTWLYPSNVACAVFAGTVNGNITSAGNYPLTISGTACGYTHTILHQGGISIPINVDTCMQNYNFAKIFPYSLNVCYPAGISQVTEGINLSIYPNPNQGIFTMSISSADRVNGTMSVLDQLGRVLKTQSIDVTGTQQIPLDLGGISAGAYLLMINTGQSRSVKQFIVR
jgi:hypothetical protein